VDDELIQVRRELERVRAENVRLSRLLDLRGQDTAPAPEQLAATRPVTMSSPVADKLALYADLFRARTDVYARDGRRLERRTGPVADDLCGALAAISGDSGTFSSSIKYECDAVARRSLDRHTQPAFEASAGRATPRGPARHPSAVAVQTPTQQGRPRSRPHAVGFEEAAAAFDAATDGAAELLADLVTAYRAFVRRHPQPYRLMTEWPLPREQLAPGVEDRAAAALVRAAGSPERARAAFAFIHSMLILELNGRFPTTAAWNPPGAPDSPPSTARLWWLDRNDHRHRERPVGRSQ
jgi:hypothetical protein